MGRADARKPPPRPAPWSAAELHGEIQNGELDPEQVRVAALVGLKAATSVWRSLSADPPWASYPRWNPSAPLGVNLARTGDFRLIGIATRGVAMAVVARAAPRDARLREGIDALSRWVADPSSADALAARKELQRLVPSGRAPRSPAARVVITALGLPALVSQHDEARDTAWTVYVREHPEARGGTRREWMQKLEQEAASCLIAVCREANAVLGPRDLDVALRDAITRWALPRQ